MSTHAKASAPPQISVVVATRNRRASLESLIEALEEQTLDPRRFELVVVDDGSDDGTAARLARRTTRFRMRLIRRDVSRGPAVARNAGWRTSIAPLVAFTDDDCRPAPEWLATLLGASNARPEAVLQGRTEPDPQQLDRIGPFARTLRVTELGPWYPTCNMAYPRSVLEQMGGFDESYPQPGGEDTDLAWRALKAGHSVAYAPAALVHHAVNELGPVGTLRLALRWSDTVPVFARHPELRQLFTLRVFWRSSHAKLVLALLAAAAVRRFPPAVVLALPYYRELAGRCNELGTSRRAMPFLTLNDALETFAMIRGGIRSRIFVL